MARIGQGAFSAGILAEGMYGRADTEKFQKGLRDAVNVFVRTQGGIANRAGLLSTSGKGKDADSEPQFLMPFYFGVDDTYMLEFQEGYFRVKSEGAYVLDSSAAPQSLTSITSSGAAELVMSSATAAQQFTSGVLAYIDDPSGSHVLHQAVVKILGRNGANLDFQAVRDIALDTSVADFGTLGPGATLSLIYQSPHSYNLADVKRVRFAQDANVLYLAHPDYPPRKISRAAADDWALETVLFGSTVPIVTGGSATATQGPDVDPNALTTYEYVISAVLEDTFEEGLPSTPFTVDNDLFYQGSKNILSWTATPEAARYNVYRLDAGAYGYVGTTSSASFTDENITPDTATGPRIDRNPFQAVGDYPSIVSFYEQRLAYGATDNDPQLVEASRTDNVENFGTSYPDQVDDAFRFRLRSRRVNRIRAFVPHTALGIMTSGGEWEIAPQGDGAYQRPDTRRLSPITYYGSADLEPVLIGGVALYLEQSGNVIRDWRLVDRSTPPGDLTVLSRDLFEGREVVSWWYAQAPYGLLWVVLDNGVLLSMTYVPEHDVWAWTRHEVGGVGTMVKQVSGIREGKVDTPYFVVTRGVGTDASAHFTERLAEREDRVVEEAYFLDGGSRYEYDQPVGSVTGLLHLREQTVSVLLDGDVLDDLVVDITGTVDFGGRKGTNISVGFAYEAEIETLGVRAQLDGLGSTEGRFKAAAEVAVKAEKSRGIEVGQSRDRMEVPKEWAGFLTGQPIPLKTQTTLYTVEGDWEREGGIVVRQPHPLPMTVLEIGPEWEFGE